jgi:hypothetical protein
MARFLPVDRDMRYAFAPSLQERLPEHCPARFAVDVVEQPDLAVIEQGYVGRGRVLLSASALTQATDHPRQVVPMLEQLQALLPDLGRVMRLLADTGIASEDHANACAQAKIQPLIGLGRKNHHDGRFRRIAEPAPLTRKPTPMAAMRQ